MAGETEAGLKLMRRIQLRLSTLVALMVAAAALLGANLITSDAKKGDYLITSRGWPHPYRHSWYFSADGRTYENWRNNWKTWGIVIDSLTAVAMLGAVGVGAEWLARRKA
ncbi:MAG: hypothetical protein HS116_19380 [Planctomycetes bacterium]|nr:hypothetical protein [Planctomycetota bacterium]